MSKSKYRTTEPSKTRNRSLGYLDTPAETRKKSEGSIDKDIELPASMWGGGRIKKISEEDREKLRNQKNNLTYKTAQSALTKEMKKRSSKD